MDVLPPELQERLFEEALHQHGHSPRPSFAHVSAVSRLAREAATRTALLSRQQDFDSSEENGEGGPVPVPTWCARRMATAQTSAATAAALEKVAQRFSQLQHVSLDLTPASSSALGWAGQHAARAEVAAGLQMFLRHVAPALAHATRLTVGGVGRQPEQRPAAAWGQLAGAPLGAHCTHLHVATDEACAHTLLLSLSSFFPAVQAVRVQFDVTTPGSFLYINAPDCLTHLCVRPRPGDSPRWMWVVLTSARGLQVLVVGWDRVWPATQQGIVVAVATPQPHHVAPALHTIRGFPQLSDNPSAWPALRSAEATMGGGVEGVRDRLLEFAVCAPRLESVRLRVGPLTHIPAVKAGELLAWAAAHLPFALSLVHGVEA